MRNLALPVLSIFIQGLCLLVASERSFSPSNQTGSSCQARLVEVTAERGITHLARDIITITLTSTSTDSTDCTCTETALNSPSNTEEFQTTSSLPASSSSQATVSRTSTDVHFTSTDTFVTRTVPASSKTSLDHITTVTDWRDTTVVSFITVTADPPTPVHSQSFTSDISTSAAVSATSDPAQGFSVSTQYTTVTVFDPSYSTLWVTTALTSETTTSQSIWSSSSEVLTMTDSGALLPSSASYSQSSNTMISTSATSTTMMLHTSATSSSQVDISATSKSSASSDFASDVSTGSITSTEEIPTSDPSASIQYITVTVHGTSYATSWTSDTGVIQPTRTSSSDSSTFSLSMSSVENSALLVSGTIAVVYTDATQSPKEGLSMTILAIYTSDAVSFSSLQLSPRPSDRHDNPTEGELDSAVRTTSILNDTAYTTTVSTQAVTQSNTESVGVFANRSSTDQLAQSTISSRVQSSTQPLVTLANPVSISADSSEEQAQTDDKSAVLSSATGFFKPSLSICPTRVSNPTYTPVSLPPRDFTWGCPPHFLCSPSKKTAHGECNFEAGPPAENYFCAPEQCIPSPPLPNTSSQNLMDSSGQIQIRYTVAPGFINLSPLQFGLGYDIFEFPQPRANSQREWAVKIPGKCYESCNNAMEAAESITKTQELCSPWSPFQVSHRACKSCVESGSGVRTSSSALPEFQQFLFYCEESASVTLKKQPPSATYSRGKTSSPMSSTRHTVKSNPTHTVSTAAYVFSHAKSGSISRIVSTSSCLPSPTTSHWIYTGEASWRYSALPLWEITVVFLLCLWCIL